MPLLNRAVVVAVEDTAEDTAADTEVDTAEDTGASERSTSLIRLVRNYSYV